MRLVGGHRKMLRREMVMQHPESHLVACTNEVLVLEICYDDREIAEKVLKRALAPTLEQATDKGAIG